MNADQMNEVTLTSRSRLYHDLKATHGPIENMMRSSIRSAAEN